MTDNATYEFGVKIGRFLRGVIVIAVIVFLLGAAYGNGMRVANSQKPAAETVKVVKHKKAKKRNYKKCACECKKVVDASRKVDYKNFIGPRD